MNRTLEDLDSLYKHLLDLSADAVLVTDEWGTVQHYSDSAQILFGYPKNLIIGQSFGLLLSQDCSANRAGFLRKLIRCIKHNHADMSFDLTVRDAGNHEFPIALSIAKAHIKGQLYYMAVCHDLSSAKQNLTEKLEIESIQNALFDAAADGIITIDAKGVIQSFNRAAQRLFGYKKSEIIGKNVSQLMPDPFSSNHDKYIHNYVSGSEAKIIGIGRDVPGKRKDHSIFPMRLSVGQATSERGPLFIGLCHDLTEYQDALIRLSKAEKRYKSIVESQSQMICRLDSNKRVTFANSAFQQAFECSFRELIGMNFVNFVSIDCANLALVFEQLDDSKSNYEANIKLIMQNKHKNFPVEWWFKKVNEDEEQDWGYQAFGIDVSEREDALQQASFLKSHDPLTGLINHEEVLHTFPSWVVEDGCYAVLLIDYNHFQLINQSYGYHAANKMLLEASQRIQRSVDGDAIISRIRADQFLVILAIDSENDAIVLAAKLLRYLEAAFTIGEDRIVPSARCGVSLYPNDSRDIEQLCRMSETALEQARHSSPKISSIDKSLQQNMRRQLDIEQGLKLAIHNEKIEIFLQPKLCLENNQIIGFEALARWHDEKLGAVSPVEFIGVAENMNMSIDVDRHIIRKTIQLMGNLSCIETKDKPVAINIASKFFADPTLYQFISQCAKIAQVPMSNIHLEITERMLMHINSEVKFNMQKLRNAGVKIAIDDFGTGYSSLAYLRDINVDELKIDKSFIDNIEQQYGQDLVSAIIAIAKAGNLEVVAEGVENAAQNDILIKMGCEYAQGYYFAKPGPFEKIYGV